MDPVQKDYKELFELFNAQGVEFLIVGAYAMAFHGVPRYTGDVGVLVRATPENTTRILRSLAAFGFGSLGLGVDDFTTPNQVVQLGVVPVRVDLLTSITGVGWDEAWGSSETGSYGDIPVRFLGKDDLVRNKSATGRTQDLADIESLGGE